MDKHFLSKLQSLSRRDEARSILLIEGAKHTLKQRQHLGILGRFIYSKKKPTIAKGWQ